jgi:hypothetical protein
LATESFSVLVSPLSLVHSSARQSDGSLLDLGPSKSLRLV